MNSVRDFSEATSGLHRKVVLLEEALNAKQFEDAMEVARSIMDDAMLTYTWAVYKWAHRDASTSFAAVSL